MSCSGVQISQKKGLKLLLKLCLLCSITLPVFFCEVLQVILVEVLITRRAKNFLWQITYNCRSSGGKRR